MHTFLNHSFPEAQQLWLKAAAAERPFDPRAAKARLFGKLPRDFDPRQIDDRFYREDRLTLLGIRVFRPDDPIFPAIETLVRNVRDQILANPRLDTLTVQELASLTGCTESLLRHAINFLSNLGSFFSGSSATPTGELERVWFSGATGYDAILSFVTIDESLQDWYERADPTLRHSFLSGSIFVNSSQLQSAVVTEPSTATKRNTAFVIMPMDRSKPELEDVLGAIKEVCLGFSIKAYRADEIEHQDRITNVILDEIRNCDVLIADLSYERPNVYYEVGYAHALNKKPILYRRQGTALHFDLSVHNVPEYRNITELRELLRRRLEAILGRSPSAT